jgi:hypothetical protein
MDVKGVTTLFAYRSLAVQPATLLALSDPVRTTYLRASMDWNEQASGVIFYDSNNPTSTTVDGVPDTIAVSPVAKWTQVSSITGTVVSVSQMPAGLGGTQSTYYRDDSTLDGADTGDQRSYGDTGFQVDDPVPGQYATLGHMYFAAGATTGVGARYEEYYDHPLEVSVGPVSPVWHAYLPVVSRQ